MVLIQTYNFFSGNIPITVNIESDKNDFVLIYKVSISSLIQLIPLAIFTYNPILLYGKGMFRL